MLITANEGLDNYFSELPSFAYQKGLTSKKKNL